MPSITQNITIKCNKELLYLDDEITKKYEFFRSNYLIIRKNYFIIHVAAEVNVLLPLICIIVTPLDYSIANPIISTFRMIDND